MRGRCLPKTDHVLLRFRRVGLCAVGFNRGIAGLFRAFRFSLACACFDSGLFSGFMHLRRVSGGRLFYMRLRGGFGRRFCRCRAVVRGAGLRGGASLQIRLTGGLHLRRLRSRRRCGLRKSGRHDESGSESSEKRLHGVTPGLTGYFLCRG
jgi:hypothetical protein